jgi:hypothetical protein
VNSLSERGVAQGPPPSQVLATVGHDLLWVCDADGRITWANEAAEDTLGASPFRPLAELVAPYAMAKAVRFLAEARLHRTEAWEMIFSCDDEPLVLALYGAPYNGGAIVAASRLPQGYVVMQEQLTASLNTVATLHREAERHRLELATAYANLREANEQLAGRSRLEGVVLAARALAHLLGNDLALPVGEVDMLRADPSLPPTVAASLATIAAGLDAAAQHVEQFQTVLRVTVKETPIGPSLDLDRSTRRDSAST